ncbi:hypothetical protein M2T82_06440 [Elizabethkingia ursingii]|uniref:hypothetical protein n=1 Tax=Elizabethkingia ursingii TaxID=1756150 RepID=UPI002010ED68|nr:hypothetical protein [Elizabethkingia ursingii]MCL1667697.1 hypothetical protein [Elizabethkingia ursingii]
MDTSIHKNLIKATSSFILTGTLLLSFTSCSSRDEETKNPDGNAGMQGTFLSFNIAGIEEDENITSLATASIKKTGKSLSASIAPEKVISTENFDALISAEGQIASDKSQGLSASLTPSYTGAMAAVTNIPMVTGTKYRLLIYDAASNTLIKNVDATSGTNPNIQVDAGKQYKWYIVSTNDNSTPSVNTSTGIVSAASLANKDVLWNQGTINAQYGQNNMSIVLKRNTARIQLDLDTRGMFGTINNTTSVEVGTGTGSTFSSIIKTGDLNVLTGQYSNLQNVSAVTGGNMVNKAGAGGASGATKTATFYTVSSAPVPSNNLRIRLNQLDLNMDDNSTRSFSNSIVPYSNIPVTPALGNRYTLNVRLIESGVRLKGLLWARSNLIYSSQADKYRFLPDNEYSQPDKDTEYWNWMAATPTGSSSDNTDACSKVYPEGMWRMPTSTEFSNLGQPDDKKENYGLFLGANFSAVYNLDAGNSLNTSFPTNSQRLFLSFYGYRTAPGFLGGTSVSDSPGGIFLGALGGGGAYYWSSTSANTNNANYWYMSYSRFAWFVGWSNAEVRSGAKTEGRMVRCVRTTSTPNT